MSQKSFILLSLLSPIKLRPWLSSRGTRSKKSGVMGVFPKTALASHARPHAVGADEQIGLLSGVVGKFDVEETVRCGGVAFELHAEAYVISHAG
jgi:hypothetical protein